MWVSPWSFLSPIVPPFSQLFKGKFYHCLGVDTRNITNRSDCVAANYRWVHHKYNFDNLGQVSPSRVINLALSGRTFTILQIWYKWIWVELCS